MTREAVSTSYEFDAFRVDTGKRLLFGAGGETIPLTPKVFDTLLYLVMHGGRLIEKDELMSAIWTDTFVEENNLNKNISVLRRILGENRNEHRFIATVPGKGYKFVAEVRSHIASDNSRGALAAENIHQLVPKSESRTFGYSMIRGRWLPAFAIFLIAAIGLSVFYLWPRNSPDAAASRGIKTIAVLPFKPLVAEHRDEVLEMGMADTLIARLASSQETVVLPLSSVRQYAGLEQNAANAGRELGADSVLDGNIQRWGDKIRVNVRLISTADGAPIWSGTFDEKFTDIFTVQDAISRKVVSALAVQLSGAEQARLEKRYTNNAAAYEYYLRGRFHFFRITPGDVRKGIEFFQKAIDADPDYALAYAAMADAYRTQAIAAHAPSKEVCPKAKELALRALEIDETLADAHIVLGWVGFLYEWDWKAAETELKRAIELAPNNSEAHRAYAHLLSSSGRHEEAIAQSDRAVELAPLTLITATLDGYFMMYAGRHQEAMSKLNKTVELEPNFWAARTALARVYTVQGRYDEAVRELRTSKEVAGGSPEPLTQLGYALAKSGKKNEAQAALEELRLLASNGYVPSYFFAVIRNGLGDSAGALNDLEKALQEREVQLNFLKIDSRWDNLRSAPRFGDLIKQMRFPE